MAREVSAGGGGGWNTKSLPEPKIIEVGVLNFVR